MSHITYNEFKNRFGDLGITKYTKAMWLEEGCEEIGKIRLGIDVICTKNDTAPETGTRYTATMPNDTELSTDIRTAKGLYGQSFNTVYDGRTYNDTRPYDIYLGGGNATIYIHLPASWTEDRCQAYLKNKVILYKKKPATTVINPAIKKEGQLGMIMNANGELQSGSGSVGSFKYEVTGGHTYDVVNAKAASSSYVKWLDADGNQIGSIKVLNSTNFPKVGDTRPMPMPSNCKYVWLLKDSSKVDLPIPLIQ